MNSHILHTVQALTDNLPSPPNIHEIATHYCVGTLEAEAMLRPHLESKELELIVGEGGVLLYRVTQNLSGSVRQDLKVEALLPTVNAVLAQKLLFIMETVQAIQHRVAQGQNLSTASEDSITELLTTLGDLCYQVADVSSEIDEGLGCQDDGDPDAAAYLLTRAKATLLRVPV
ncbi:hypothetical protein [Deinococcus petrolearius]|uniref:Uncharacterized protein n=1 Tax=Deinococcus petrolearius TaxID=1751295 RepID=A0ABW1DL79_9DEIO